MSKPRQLILGAAIGYGAAQVRVFVKSLRASGYAGDATMFVGAGSRDLMAYLRTRDVEPIPIINIRRLQGPIHSRRLALFANYLDKRVGNYDQVMTTDVRDVAFQADPFAAVTDKGVQFYLESAAHTISTEKHNAGFIRMFLRQDQIEALGPRRITCCGVIIGGAQEMRDYLDNIRDRTKTIPLRKRRKIGADTAFHFVRAYLEPAPGSAIVENNLHVATMGLEGRDRYLLQDGRILLPESGFAPPILHQYDRYPDITAAFAAKYGA